MNNTAQTPTYDLREPAARTVMTMLGVHLGELFEFGGTRDA